MSIRINMSVNFSSIDNFSSSISSFDLQIDPCFRSGRSIFVFAAHSIINLLLLPLFIFILYLGYHQMRQQHSISMTATSHSDLFTYHATAMELNEFLALIFIFAGGYMALPEMMLGGLCICYIVSFGQGLFQILTCVDHYLAIVHPITYLHMRQASRVRIRTLIACVWLLSFGWMAVWFLTSSFTFFIVYCCCVAFTLIIVSFCSISVLCALMRQGPREVGGNKKQVDHSKKRAFYTILAIMGLLLIRFVGNLTSNIIYKSKVVNADNYCVVLMSTVWLDLPSSLVLPLLFLQRIGKLQCCKQKN